jgi:DNA polymerase-3 subunit delta
VSAAPEPLLLVLGDEELLVERAVRTALAAAREADASADLTRTRVTDLTPPELAELLSPSLFAEGRVVVLEGAQEVGKEIADAVLSYAKEPADGIVLMVLHTGGGRSKAAKDLPGALKKAGAAVVECSKLTKPADRDAFVKDEVRRAGGKIDPAGLAAQIETIGNDLPELAAAASQLVTDNGGKIDEAAVRRYHQGKAEVNGFAVADLAVVGDRAGAMEALRWAMQLGVPHVLVADALAEGVRTVAKVASAGRGDPFRMAGDLGMPPWKVKRAQGQARGWTPTGLAAAMQIVAALNADVKGVAADADYALERAVLKVVAAHQMG